MNGLDSRQALPQKPHQLQEAEIKEAAQARHAQRADRFPATGDGCGEGASGVSGTRRNVALPQRNALDWWFEGGQC